MSREGYKNSSRISRRRSRVAHRFINFKKPKCILLLLRLHAFEIGLLSVDVALELLPVLGNPAFALFPEAEDVEAFLVFHEAEEVPVAAHPVVCLNDFVENARVGEVRRHEIVVVELSGVAVDVIQCQ